MTDNKLIINAHKTNRTNHLRWK